MEDTNFCVYIHISNQGDIFYVGQGREHRAFSRALGGRAKEWGSFTKDGFDVYIPYYNLTKDEAVRLEKQTIIKLREQGHPLVNKSLNDGVRTLTREMFENDLECNDNSKFGLIWKSDTFNRKRKGESAGGISKPTGYAIVTHKGIQYFAHRIVMALKYGECPKHLQVNHIDGNKLNNRVSNLEFVTASENVRHAIRTKLIVPRCGSENSMAILTEEQVLQIYDRLARGSDNDKIAAEFNLKFKHVSLIRNGSRWKHLYEQYGQEFKKSKKELVNSRVQVFEVISLIRNTDYTNKKISEITGVEVSQVSRIRHSKAFLRWIEEYDTENTRHISNLD